MSGCHFITCTLTLPIHVTRVYHPNPSPSPTTLQDKPLTNTTRLLRSSRRVSLQNPPHSSTCRPLIPYTHFRQFTPPHSPLRLFSLLFPFISKILFFYPFSFSLCLSISSATHSEKCRTTRIFCSKQKRMNWSVFLRSRLHFSPSFYYHHLSRAPVSISIS